MTEAEETWRFCEAAAGARDWIVEGETMKYLEMVAPLCLLVDEARERSTELESSMDVEKCSAL
ncbi:hypothetical protein Acr_03g0015360 [Actinidia rufa]|uniref:Uncharacterized protein n=1 Tax=Actinidia rufa TaxID=165716 RepID=A0A7J0EEK0_9ERIC|nr:hypothetical protein Acr_03g0015360 [Actinidia rufa]